jgi:hypothetical protein
VAPAQSNHRNHDHKLEMPTRAAAARNGCKIRDP